MKENWEDRTEKLIGKEALEKLENSKVIIYGIGGVGSYVVEALARAGVGNLSLVDPDKISISNINRQIHSNFKTVGKNKIEVMKERILEINPKANVEIFNPKELDFEEQNLINNTYSYVVDAVDTIKTKLEIGSLISCIQSSTYSLKSFKLISKSLTFSFIDLLISYNTWYSIFPS